MKINIGFNSKRYTRDMSYDNNTTYGFGDVQPLLSQFMLPDSDIKISAKSLVRLSPLKFPCFGRLRLELVSRFVPVTDVYAPFESFISNLPYAFPNGSNGVPTSLPNITQNVLFLSLLPYSTFTIYMKDSSGNFVVDDTFSQVTFGSIFLPALASTLGITDYSYKHLTIAFSQLAIKNPVTSLGADYVVHIKDSSEYMLCVRLNAVAQRLRKIYIGLGYDVLSPVISKPLKVSILPLLAFYKSYFDTYYPTREINFTQTKAFALINLLNSSLKADFSSEANTLLFNQFRDELAMCFYASQDDYISLHTSTPVNIPSSVGVYSLDNNGGEVYASSTTGTVLAKTSGAWFSASLLKQLSVFSPYINKNSVIGQRVSQWLKTHFNSDVENTFFKDSNFVGRHSIPVIVGDVFSTSDTAQSDGTGEALGAYAGKGIGVGEYSFKFHSSCHGYLFVFACIVPEARTYQGTDSTLTALTRYELPTPEFDALGYELTDKRTFISNNGLFNASPSSETNGFGYVPRYTGFKYRKNIVNGDFSRRSKASTLDPYFLDRQLIANTLESKDNVPVAINSHTLPVASPQWRFITRYGYLGNFNRIFIQNNDLSETPGTETKEEYVENFISQSLFHISLRDSLKPLKSSFDTFDEENDNNVSSVNPE